MKIYEQSLTCSATNETDSTPHEAKGGLTQSEMYEKQLNIISNMRM
jgi:hypothetical protein